MKSRLNPHFRFVSLSAASTLLINLCFSTAHAAELVTNGNFSANAGAFTSFPGYVGVNPSPTGWTTTTGNTGVNGSSAPHSPFAPATNVPTFLFMQNGAATASQALATTNGSHYLFSFDAAARNTNTTAGVNVFANDTQPASLALNGAGGSLGWLNTNSFQRYAFGFTATGAQTIKFAATGTGPDFTTDITNVSVSDVVSSQYNIANATLFFNETSGTHNYGFSLTGDNQSIYRRPGSPTYTGNITTNGSAGALSITANENEGTNNLTFSGSTITLGPKSLNVTGTNVDNAAQSLNSKVTLTNSPLTTDANVNVGRGSLEITGSTSLTIGGQLRSGVGGDWASFIMNPGTSVTATGGVDFKANGVVASGLFLNGGTLTTPYIYGNSYVGQTNVIFNGTTVVASADSADFLHVRINAGSDVRGAALIGNGGAIFNTNGRNISIQNPLANNSGSTGRLTKNGTGTLTLTGANSYSGVTTLAGGVLNVASLSNYGANGGLGNRASDSGPGNVGILFQGGTLQYTGATPQSTNRAIRISTTGGATIDASGSNPAATVSFTASSSPDFFENPGNRTLTLTGSNTGDNTFAMAIGQAGGTTDVVKSGTGKWVLSGTSTYSGATTVSAGTLFVTGALSSNVTVSDNATVGGGGSVGAISFGGGALFDIFLAVNSLDSLTSAGISFAAAGFGIDNLVSQGAEVNWGTIANGTYTLITGNLVSANLGNFGSANAANIGGGRTAYFQNGSLQLVVVPEPSVALLSTLGMLALLRRKRA